MNLKFWKKSNQKLCQRIHKRHTSKRTCSTETFPLFQVINLIIKQCTSGLLLSEAGFSRLNCTLFSVARSILTHTNPLHCMQSLRLTYSPLITCDGQNIYQTQTVRTASYRMDDTFQWNCSVEIFARKLLSLNLLQSTISATATNTMAQRAKRERMKEK